jgi:hypothetical protein
MGNSTTNQKHETVAAVGQSVKQKAEEVGSHAAEKAKSVASAVSDKAKQVADEVSHTVGNVASTLGRKAEDATAAVGSGMTSLADTIEENAPHAGVIGAASSAVAHTLEEGGQYLKDKGLKGVGDDLTTLIRNHPLPTLFIGIGLGYLLARANRS